MSVPGLFGHIRLGTRVAKDINAEAVLKRRFEALGIQERILAAVEDLPTGFSFRQALLHCIELDDGLDPFELGFLYCGRSRFGQCRSYLQWTQILVFFFQLIRVPTDTSSTAASFV